MRLQTPDFSKAPTTTRPQNAGSSMADDASRVDGVAKVTGSAKYSRDRFLPNSLYVAFLRCPWGSADLVQSDVTAAKAIPGVLEIEITRKTAEYHGRDMGYVVAESPRAMARAVKAVELTWQRKPVKVGIPSEDKELDGDAKTDFEKAPIKLDAVYSTPVQTHVSLETHGCVVDHRGDSATVYASTQGTFSFRDGLDKPLELEQSKFEVICEYIGGGFGSKLGGAGKEGNLAAKIAGKYKRPVYLFVNRAEEHTDTGNRPSSRVIVRLGIEKDGTIVGGQMHSWGGVGVAGGGGGTSIASGRYDLGDVKPGHTDVKFNAGGPRPMRAPGKPQGAFVEELVLDEVAHLCSMDPLELRKKLLRGAVHKKMLAAGAKMIGWDQRKPNGSQTGVIRRGFGVGTTSWSDMSRVPSSAEVVIHRDGSVEARTGTQDIGTGQRTIMTIAAATTLGVPISVVSCAIGSSKLPNGPGSGGSITAPSTVPSMESAAADAREKLLEIAAKSLSCKAEDLSIKEGQILRGGQKAMSFADACSKMTGDSLTGSNGKRDTGKGHCDGAQFVDLTVDTETGVVSVKRIVAIQSVGRVVCRKTAESQIMGGVIQCMSFALFEQRVLDRVTGSMLNANMESYKILGSKDMPRIEPVLWTKGQTGVRSAGEPPAIPMAGAIAGAVLNAIGRPVRSLPITPDKVLAALSEPATGGKGGAA